MDKRLRRRKAFKSLSKTQGLGHRHRSCEGTIPPITLVVVNILPNFRGLSALSLGASGWMI